MDLLKISKTAVRFEGFESLKNKATFCFYDQSVVIIPGDPQNRSKKIHFTVEFDGKKECENIFLVKRLRDRGVPDESEFIYIHGAYYEFEQHPVG